MQERIKRRNFKIYALDIESHNDNESIALKTTSMWLGSFIDETSEENDPNSYFYSMEELIERLDTLSNPKRKHGEKRKPCKNICIYIYNLSFEWSFLLPVLIEKGFAYKEKISNEDSFVYNSVSTMSASSIWLAQIKININGGIILFRDLAKIYGGGLGKVAKSFGLPTQKGEIDYTLNRLHSHIVTDEERSYCFKDTRIIVDILLEMEKRGDKVFFQNVSMASYTMDKMLRFTYKNELRPYHAFRSDYPELSKLENDFLWNSVKGGITYPTPRWQFLEITEKMASIDATQMHPTQMVTKQFPYGNGTYFEGVPVPKYNTINCCHIKIGYSGVKLHSCIELIGQEFGEEIELYKWDFEIETMKKVYENLTIEYIDGYNYKIKSLPFKNYIINNLKERLKCKEKGDEFGVLYYKLLNNSAYGKFIEHPHNEIIKNIIGSDGIITSEVEEKDDLYCKDNAKYTYIPVGSCISAYSRSCLIETALKFGYKNVVYFDTDSIYYVINDETEKACNSLNHDKWFGGWTIEHSDIIRFQAAAPKRYKFEDSKKVSFIKMAGVNFKDFISAREKGKEENEKDNQVYYNEINIVNSTFNVQRAYRCKGGTLIEFEKKEISVPKKYQAIYNMNNLQ